MRSRSRIAVRFSASILSGIGLAGLQADWTAEAAAPRGRHRGADVTVAERPAKTPVMAIVALRQQRVTIYDEDGPILQAPVSTGQTGYETPAGIYSVLEKQVEHYSNLYDDASMPFMQRLTWSGIALHAGVLPGYPASHGCIRMPTGFAERLFQRTKLGMPVVIVRDDIAPADFTHPALFRPLPSDTAALDPGLASGTEARGPDKVAARLADASASVAPLPPAPRRSLRAIAAAKSAAAAAAAAKAEEARVAARSATIAAAGATRTIRRAEGVKARAGLQLRQAERQAEQARAVADTAGGDGTGAAAVPAHPASGRLQQAKAALAAAEAQLAQVKTEMQPKVDLALQLRQQAKEAQQASQAAQEDAKEAARRLAPVSVFISRATQRLYVRQAREPLFDAPVAIADPGRPLGTYVFTALAYAKGETDLRWTAVSMYRSGGERKAEAGRRADGHRHAGPARADLPGARQALDRITIPQEARERIAEVAAPGTSLIVSDESLSKETGKATGFIVLMSSEPQGGIRIRRRSPEAGWRYQQRPSYRGSPFGWGSSQPSWPWW